MLQGPQQGTRDGDGIRFFRRLAALTLLLTATVAPAVASTDTAHGRHIAFVIWGPVCDSQVTVERVRLGGDFEGMSRWSIKDDGSFTDCVIQIDDSFRMTRSETCQVLVHEVGHLAGQEHSTNPRSVMFPWLGNRNMPARCR